MSHDITINPTISPCCCLYHPRYGMAQLLRNPNRLWQELPVHGPSVPGLNLDLLKEPAKIMEVS